MRREVPKTPPIGPLVLRPHLSESTTIAGSLPASGAEVGSRRCRSSLPWNVAALRDAWPILGTHQSAGHQAPMRRKQTPVCRPCKNTRADWTHGRDLGEGALPLHPLPAFGCGWQGGWCSWGLRC
ncbi:uncharacterized protein LOC120620408 isoform X2 [Pteropus medius]|uniref:uncharacterized protein LOC120620408 isoform X2 n=1 Tax=Pteropus vampyrus TaxID=132908 RepID=UPI00196BB00C|nr:uncharacterized protein LOC120620408 isoform X2 [Pteropus giganteus]